LKNSVFILWPPAASRFLFSSISTGLEYRVIDGMGEAFYPVVDWGNSRRDMPESGEIA
jgi:hypothetical protein